MTATIPGIGLGEIRLEEPQGAEAAALVAVDPVGSGTAVLARDETAGALHGSPLPGDALLAEGWFLNDIAPAYARAGVRWDRRRSAFTPADVRCRSMIAGILGDDLQPPAANLLEESCGLDKSAWIALGLRIVPNAAAAPDGSATADLLIPLTGGQTPLVFQEASVGAAPRFTVSIFLKADGVDRVLLQARTSDPHYATAQIDLTAGTIIRPNDLPDPRDVRCTAVGGGWWHVGFSVATGSGTTVPAFVLLPDGISTADEGVLAWGAQLSATEHPVPTTPTGSTATSGAPEIFATDLMPLTIDEGTVLAIGQPWWRDGEPSTAHPILHGPVTIDPGAGTIGLGAGMDCSPRPELMGVARMWTVAWDASGQVIYENGQPIAQDATASVPAGSLTVGGDGAGAAYGGDLAILAWPRRLTDAEIAQVATTLGCGGKLPVVCWGDSLTQGVYGHVPWPSNLPGRPVLNRGISGADSILIRDSFLADSQLHRRVTIICSGRNNSHDRVAVVADVQAMIDALATPRRFLVLSVLNGAEEGVGTASYANIIALNADLAAAFPGAFLDVRAPLVAQGTMAEQAQDIIPASLQTDGLHLNTAGNQILAATVDAELANRGW